MVEGLTLLFNYVLSKEIWPARWSTGIIFPLYKHESRLEPSNYRPITLLSVVGKLFGRIINERLLAWSERTGMICDEQGGFRPMRGAPTRFSCSVRFLRRERRGICRRTPPSSMPAKPTTPCGERQLL